MKSHWTSVFLRRGEATDRNTHRESHVVTEAEIGVLKLQAKENHGGPRVAGSHQMLRRGKEGFFPRLQRELDPAGTLILNSSLQNYERIHFCCVKPPSSWYFVTAGLGNRPQLLCTCPDSLRA